MKKQYDGEIYFTPKQAAEYLNLSLSTIKNYIYADKLKTLKTPGGHHRIRKSELLDIMGAKDALFSRTGTSDDLLELCCTTLLNVFKVFGSAGNSLIIHSKSVSEISSLLSKAMGLTEVDVVRVKMAGLVHDIGFIGSDKVHLSRTRTISDSDYELLKTHPTRGREMISSVESFKDIADIVGQHHERPDGRGYPNGLKGNQIHILARILSIAEAYDSMVSTNSYKRPVSKEEAITELLQNKGSQFDTEIVDLFTRII